MDPSRRMTGVNRRRRPKRESSDESYQRAKSKEGSDKDSISSNDSYDSREYINPNLPDSPICPSINPITGELIRNYFPVNSRLAFLRTEPPPDKVTPVKVILSL